MKKNRLIVFGLMTLFIALILVSCAAGTSDPKALAKQTYDLTQQALAAASSPLKMAGVAKKMAAVQKKVDRLPAAGKKAYDEELAQLYGQGVAGLLGIASDSSDASSILQSVLGTAGQGSSSSSNADRKEINDFFKDFEKCVKKMEKEKNKNVLALSALEFSSLMLKETGLAGSDSWTDSDSKKAESLYNRGAKALEKLD